MIIEAVIIKYLQDANIQGIGQKVYAETPVDEPNEYIKVEKTGGPMEDGIVHATIAIQSYSATSLLRAAEINEAMKDLMEYLPDYSNVYGCTLNTDYNYTDPDTRMYRYQAVFVIDY